MGIGIFIFIVALGAILAYICIDGYNRLVAQRNRYKNAYAQIDVQLQRRYDLIPNLVEIAKKYLAHERETLEAVIAARNTAIGASSRAARDPGAPAAMQDLSEAEGSLTGALGRLFAVSESYPDLKIEYSFEASLMRFPSSPSSQSKLFPAITWREFQ